ncbi:Fc.00g031390.m01.CDS01 [Cosmosporella sp. VM-42]
MSSKDIRLRLVVRRHAVPEVKLVWPCVASEDLTIAKLLAQVNEVVPLESAEWGLEDYVVELADGQGGSYECLHFQPVGKLFKEDDQVVIRSLLTEDLKRRRLSGRHQISTDGKHLIDGLAFGRPWLRVPRDRPSLDLPPRKRARLTYEEQQDDEDDADYNVDDDLYEDDDYQPEQLLLEGPEPIETDEPSSIGLYALFDDADLDTDDNDKELEDVEDEFVPGDVEEDLPIEAEDSDEDEVSYVGGLDEELQDLDEEIRLLKEDNAVIGDDTEDSLRVSSNFNINLTSLDHITALRSAFPLTSVTDIEKNLVLCKNNLRQTYERLATRNDPTISFDEMMDRAICGPSLFQSGLLPEEDLTFNGFASQDAPSSSFKGLSSPRRPLIEEVESLDTSADIVDRRDSHTTGTLTGNRSANDEVIPDSEETSSSGSSSGEDEESSDSDSDADDNDDDSSEDGDDNDDSDDNDPTLSSGARSYLPGNDVVEKSGSDNDSSESDMDSDADDQGGAGVHDAEDSDSSDDSSDGSSSSDDDSDSESEPEEVTSKSKVPAKAPGSSAVPQLAKEPEPPAPTKEAPPPAAPGCGLTRTQKRNARRREAKRIKQLEALQSQSPAISEVETEDPELLARKQALLSAVNDQVPEPMEVDKVHEVDTTTVDEPQESPAVESPTVEPSQEPTPSTGAESAPRRMKVDMGAGRRLLFGALGLKNPKSKADEDKLRKNLMKDVRPLKNQRIETIPQADGATNDKPEEPEDPDAWREKISYRAVECCEEGVVLSEPPFPFVQRWDPQQQFRKKRKRNSQTYYDDSYYNDSYYEEDSQWNENGGEWDDVNTKKSKKRKSKGGYEEEVAHDSHFGKASADENVVLDYDEPAKRPGSSQFTDVDDLPSLPSDLNTLSALDFSDVKPGMVVTWQQLLMSKATNWQPQVASVTGMVLTVSGEDSLDVLLAKRDREPSDKVYDTQTGKRVYDKFEAPADDEDDEDDGRREVSWSEISAPRLVQQAPPPSVLATPAKGGLLPVDNSEDNKVSRSRDREEGVAKESDTQEVRAGVDAELKELATKKAESDNSTSIPSGQEPLRLDLENPSTNVSAETAHDSLNSPSRQLQETSFAAIIEKPTTGDVTEEEQEAIVEPESMEVDVDQPLDFGEDESEAIIPDSMPSLDIPSKPLRKETYLTPAVDHPAPAVASSVSSIHSGRQPPSNYGLGESLDEDDSIIPETTPRAHETTPTPQSLVSNHSSRSSSPFSSLEEIYHTAATSRLTQSPAKSTQQSILRTLKGRGKQDLEYEEAMRKLDEGDEESDHSQGRNKSIRSLFPNATQPEPLLELPKLERLETPPQAKMERKSPFKIPEGSQVITLSSSPASVRFSEDYAHDSIDESYKDSPSPLPKGSGSVKREESDVLRRETRSRGKSLPAATSGSARPQTRGLSQKPNLSMLSAVSQIKRRRTTGRKF